MKILGYHIGKHSLVLQGLWWLKALLPFSSFQLRSHSCHSNTNTRGQPPTCPCCREPGSPRRNSICQPGCGRQGRAKYTLQLQNHGKLIQAEVS